MIQSKMSMASLDQLKSKTQEPQVAVRSLLSPSQRIYLPNLKRDPLLKNLQKKSTSREAVPKNQNNRTNLSLQSLWKKTRMKKTP